MESNVLIEKLEKLPLERQREVEDFVDFLLAKQTSGILLTANEVAEPTESYGRGFGSLKGQIFMSDDFDEPLEDFNEYM